MTFDQFKGSTMLAPVNHLAELFLLAGDIHATLYTGSKAMHSEILNIFKEETGKFSKFSAVQNVKITVQRRFHNYLNDSSRQKQLEMFLGLRLYKHLPSIPMFPLKVGKLTHYQYISFKFMLLVLISVYYLYYTFCGNILDLENLGAIKAVWMHVEASSLYHPNG